MDSAGDGASEGPATSLGLACEVPQGRPQGHVSLGTMESAPSLVTRGERERERPLLFEQPTHALKRQHDVPSYTSLSRSPGHSQLFHIRRDSLFAQKCRELRGFIRPLLILLNGLKSGRFEKGLSSLQHSVAIDRIQRIVGVLQKPGLGGRYLSTLLQVELMLKIWFPQVTASNGKVTDITEAQQSLREVSETGEGNGGGDLGAWQEPVAVTGSMPPAEVDARLSCPLRALTWVRVMPRSYPAPSSPGAGTEGSQRHRQERRPHTQDSAVTSSTPQGQEEALQPLEPVPPFN